MTDTTTTTNLIYYRRADFPAQRPSDVEVTAEAQVTGPYDGAWHAVPSDDGLAESLGLAGQYTDCLLIADALVIYRACLDSGLCDDEWRDGEWLEYEYSDLDMSLPEAYEQMCGALRLLSPSDATRQAWRIVRTCPETKHGRMVRDHMAEVAQSYGEDPFAATAEAAR